ncbi:hypothetical protein LCGC14_2437050 [marine sediment metagenome]|uniref:Uncharacterized protein n=1 Tax=marine sediment metagenome TaxID=412755 RepID=A0A0F9BKB3_9ZZZZ
MEIEKLTYEDATHNLLCRHAVGTHGYDYHMKCVILKEMPNRRLKLLVFGERNWKRDKDKKRIRYVDAFRVSQCVVEVRDEHG